MARILGFQYGEMRGKLGGNVFSRNKAGAYVRAKVTPVNPKTVRQQTARYRFGNMSILYQSISNTLKDCWEVFARTHFNPLKGNSTGIYNGGNAFVALRQSAGQGNEIFGSLSGEQSTVAISAQTLPYLEVTEPPSEAVSATLKDSDGLVREFTITNIVVQTDNKLKFNINTPSGNVEPTARYDAFVDATNQKFGIGFYFSNNLKFEGAKPNTALKINPFDTGVVDSLELGAGPNGPIISQTLEMEILSTINKEDIKDYPCSGDIILVTPFVRSESGAQKMMAPQYVTVTAP